MSPPKFRGGDVTKGVINGPNPLPLRISRNSHLIHKTPLNQHASAAAAAKSHGHPVAKRQPIIIYTHSPRVIRTKVNEFRNLVQTLTGAGREKDKAEKSPEVTAKAEGSIQEERNCGGGVDNNVNNVGFVEKSETAPVLSGNQRFTCDVKQKTAVVPPMYEMPNTLVIEAPLLTPSPGAFFCPERTSSLLQPPNVAASSFSPSFMDYMKAFPEF